MPTLTPASPVGGGASAWAIGNHWTGACQVEAWFDDNGPDSGGKPLGLPYKPSPCEYHPATDEQ